MYKSQFGQDRYCFERFFKTHQGPGTFVELGAEDGVRFSNTYYFEKKLGWRGLCIEPRPDAFAKLKQKRDCACECVAIDTNARDNVPFLHIKGWGQGLSGLVDRYDPKHQRRIAREIRNPKHVSKNVINVNCVPLQQLLDKHKLTHIDFLSLDTEGSELAILKSIDWDRTHIDVMTVENNYRDEALRTYLKSKGYRFVTRIHCDEVFTRRPAS